MILFRSNYLKIITLYIYVKVKIIYNEISKELSQQNNIEKQNIYFQFQNNYYKKKR